MKPVVIFTCAWLVACASDSPAVEPDAGIDAAVDAGDDASTDSGVDGGHVGDAGPSERRIFVTDTTRSGDMGGIAGADAMCAAQAEAAGLQGEFRAWLSTLSSPVSDRFVQSAVRYVLVDGTVIADDWEDLTDGAIQAPINLDASGQVRGGDVWTGTVPSGESYADGDCDGFTSGAGDIRSLCGSTQFSDGRWTEAQIPACSTSLRLFCMEQ